jgi:hypothetical protein
MSGFYPENFLGTAKLNEQNRNLKNSFPAKEPRSKILKRGDKSGAKIFFFFQAKIL